MIKFEEKVYNFIEKEQLFVAGDKALIGVSGGADSVCLLRVLHSLSDSFDISGIVVAHINHMIRGDEADEDEAFTKELCDGLGVPFFSYKRDVPALSKELGISAEEAGRRCRYEIFEKLACEQGCTKIAVAHHRNDLAETVIFNMLRGSGLSGLSAMDASRGRLVRPLLGVSRQEIEEYLEEINQNFRTDSTNELLDYTRNKIRHIIIPAMEEINPEACGHIASLAFDAGQADEYISKEALGIREKTMSIQDAAANCTLNNVDKIVFDIDKLKGEEEILINRVIHDGIAIVAGRRKDITRRHIDAVRGLLYQSSGKKLMLPYDIVAKKNYGELVIEKKVCTGEEIEGRAGKCLDIKVDSSGSFRLPDGILNIEISEGKHQLPVGKNVYTKIVDYDKIQGDIRIRFPEAGDYIVIDTEGKTKKLNRVFIDNKISRDDRACWPVVACGSEIIWAVGLRYNESYRVTENTARVMLITYEDNVG